MLITLGEDGDAAKRQLYNPRAKAETVTSVTKRKGGECLTARKDEAQERQALLRGVVYNLHRLRVLSFLCAWALRRLLAPTRCLPAR